MFFQTFKNWFSRKKPDPIVWQRDRCLHALKKVEQLPALPDTAMRALALARDPSVSIADFASLIKRDASLTTTILRLANSVVYRGTHPVASIEKAVLRLGIRHCSQVIAAFGMHATFRPTEPRTQGICQVLLRHAFFTASLCSYLNNSLCFGFDGEEFSAGMLHDIGRLMLAATDSDIFTMVDPLDFDEKPEQLEKERSQLGTDHSVIGAEYARRSRLSSAVTSCILHHHSREILEENNPRIENPRLVALVAFADEATNHAQRERRISDFDFKHSVTYWQLARGQGRGWHEQFPSHLAMAVRRAILETRALIKSSK